MSDIIDFHDHPLYDFHIGDHGVRITPEVYMHDLKACGISHACGSVIYQAMNGLPVAAYETIVPHLNEQALSLRDHLNPFYSPGIHIHPSFPDMSCREIDNAHAQNVHLIGELVPYMMGWRTCACPGMIDILSYAAQKGMVVSIHPTNIADMTALAEALPQLQIVYAHLNGSDEELELMRRHDNVCFDFSAYSSYYEGLLRHTIDRVGSDRLLFGTDFPGYTPALDLESALSDDLTDTEREALLGGNAKRLLKL